jgi:hypothetical protein
MALKLSAKAPNGASTSVARPVIVMSRDTGMSYPVARITATPGRFCEAMVTTNRGSARLTSALTLNCGAVKTGTASSKSSPRSRPFAP